MGGEGIQWTGVRGNIELRSGREPVKGVYEGIWSMGGGNQ